MEPSELLRFVVTVLERLHLRYFVTGSTVTIFYGEPRFTNDIDIVVDLPADSVTAFCQAFPDDEFYVSEAAAGEAVRRHGMFNIIQPRTGLKVDVIVAPQTPFNQSRFARAARVRAGADWEASFASPEDAVLKKMDFYRAGGSDKHLRDIAGVLRTSGERIEHGYIERWAESMGLTDIWQAILERLRQP